MSEDATLYRSAEAIDVEDMVSSGDRQSRISMLASSARKKHPFTLNSHIRLGTR